MGDDQESGFTEPTETGERTGESGDGSFELPLFPLSSVLFPGMPLPLHIFEERYRRLMREHHADDPIFGVVLTRQGREVGDQAEIHEVGTTASLIGLRQYPDGRYDIAVRGERRFRVIESSWDRAYLVGRIAYLDEEADEGADLGELASRTLRAYEAFVAAVNRATGSGLPVDTLPYEPAKLANVLATALPINTWERQALLEAGGTAERLRQVTAILQRERGLLVQAGAAGPAVEFPGTRFQPN